jgi:eukaryotic translation initiation factor 2C
MAGATKHRAQAEKKPQGSSQGSSSASRDPTQRSTKSIPRLDGNRDPSALAPIDYTRPTDLKNISEFLGIGGWYAARGVSTNALLSQPTCAYMHVPEQTRPTTLSSYANRLQSALRWRG